MIKFPGVGAAASGLLGQAGGIAQATIGTVMKSGPGGAGQVKQENSDLTKVVQDLLHDKLMSRMGGAESPLGGGHLPRMEGGHGPVVPQGEFGGLRPHGGPMQSAMKENGDLKKLLGDLLQQRVGGGQPAAQPQAQSPMQAENDDLKKLLGDLLKSLTGGQGAQQAQPSGLQGENQDLMKLLSDLLKGGGGAQRAGGGEEDGKGGLLEQLMKQNEQMKSVLGAMQQMMQSVGQSSPLAMTQQMMTQSA